MPSPKVIVAWKASFRFPLPSRAQTLPANFPPPPSFLHIVGRSQLFPHLLLLLLHRLGSQNAIRNKKEASDVAAERVRAITFKKVFLHLLELSHWLKVGRGFDHHWSRRGSTFPRSKLAPLGLRLGIGGETRRALSRTRRGLADREKN